MHNPLANDRLRIPSPIIDDRLHVPPDDLLRYLGCTVHAEGATVTARLADRQLRFSEVEGLSIEGGETRPELAGRLWRARLVVPAAELCRFLGLSLRFDKPTLTATVGQ
ncbi:MAG: hypothetical protein FJX74_19650 [Armatimonadetes bacterium]|nr:hypothetical protein [Armatimonadota bacterium]